jgi:uncharacterized protein (DUF983 family)
VLTQADCSESPDGLTVAIICAVVTGCVLWLAWDIRKHRRGARWVATMIGGMLFGWVVEFINTHDVLPNHHIYCYPHTPIDVFGVPYWVPVGWGGIIYASTWTAQRLRLHRWARPIAAAFLAASIDFSLDPVSRLMRFWSWDSFAVSFIDVPYDNFIGWYLIVFVYASTAAWLLRLWKGRGPVYEWLGGILCAVAAMVVFLAAEYALSKVQSYSQDDGHIAAGIFMVTTIVGIVVTVFLARKAVVDTDPPHLNWPVMWVPAIIHITCFALYFCFSFLRDATLAPMLVATIPIQFLAGLFVFVTPWRRALMAKTAAAATSPPSPNPAPRHP